MQTTDLEAALDEGTAGYRLLDHPFYRRWEAGLLERRELASYAAQYRHFEGALPSFLERLAAALPPGAARQAVLDNLADELGDPVAHLELFERFGRSVGATDEAPGPAARGLCEAYDEVLGAGPVAALAGLLAYERQAPEVAASKAEGLRAHYGLPGEGTAFWDHHAEVDVTHSRWTTATLASLDPDPAVVRAATRRIARAWWEFLDERQAAA